LLESDKYFFGGGVAHTTEKIFIRLISLFCAHIFSFYKVIHTHVKKNTI
jgi:hypothetical protein